MSIAISDDSGRMVFLKRPDPDHVARIVDLVLSGQMPFADLPAYGNNRWTANNADWILSRWLPGNWAHPRTGAKGLDVARALVSTNAAALYVMVESYLASVDTMPGVELAYEVACCNGSSWVSDEILPCGVWAKDPAAMPHDYLFDLHHAAAADCFGNVWTFADANKAYCDIYAAAGLTVFAASRRIGLPLFARGVWNAGKSRGGLASARFSKPL